jgi:hypothetical protein
MKSIYLVFSEGSEMEIVGSSESYETLKLEYLYFMKGEEQKVFNFTFENDGELLISFDELVAIYAEDFAEDED